MASETGGADAYRSIYLDEGWAHQRHYGWHVAHEAPGLRVLAKRYVGFSRFLVLAWQADRAALEAAVRHAVGKATICAVVIHDFRGLPADGDLIAGRRFRAASAGQAMLNRHTLVIDLSRDEGGLAAALRPNMRRQVRRAAETGAEVAIADPPDRATLDRFLAGFADFAPSKGLRNADAGALASMARAGDVLIATASRDGTALSWLVVYRTGDAAISLHGFNARRDHGFAGHLLQWRVLMHLKAQGVRWYDFGGVHRFDLSDGLYAYKRRFGGAEVDLGAEHVWESPGYPTMMRLKTALGL